MEEQQKQKFSQVREQSQSLKSHVTSQSVELHQILVKKEQRILGEIKEDEEKILSQMEKNLQDIQENVYSIEEELSNLQGRMDQTDIVLFLKVRGYVSILFNETAVTTLAAIYLRKCNFYQFLYFSNIPHTNPLCYLIIHTR
ncbi:nuclear factor 7, ovary-like [Amblyraja radiata]|uniref:nuclear factor 7, ovary-like n=1 Tax=Amblyraja radiata TaxID=386614 RepID=UPI001402E581|nr:nuclear factor 7, ovary-like [Amblyraja radiata]